MNGFLSTGDGNFEQTNLQKFKHSSGAGGGGGGDSNAVPEEDIGDDPLVRTWTPCTRPGALKVPISSRAQKLTFGHNDLRQILECY